MEAYHATGNGNHFQQPNYVAGGEGVFDTRMHWFKWSTWAATVLLMWTAATNRKPPQVGDVGHDGARGMVKKGNGKRGAASPLWLGTSRWAIEGTKVGGRRLRRARASGSYRILRLGASEWWRLEWEPWKGERLGACQTDWRDTMHPLVHNTLAQGGGTAYRKAATKMHYEGDEDQDPRPSNAVGAWPRGRIQKRREVHSRRRLVGYGTCKTVVALVMAAALAGLRIGEASNPGYGLQDPNIMKLKEVTLAEEHGKRLTYADPDKVGFRGGKSPGFHKEDRLKGSGTRPQRESQMKVESANVTGPAGLRTRLRATRADILLAQETWGTEESIPDLREWARKQKWTSLWAPAKPGTNGGRPSGGAAIFVRNHLGLREPDLGGSVWRQHRACAGIVEVPGYRPTICVAAYFQSGDGWGNENTALMASIGAGLEAQGKIAGRIRPTIIGVDANMTPEEFSRSGVGEKAGLQIVRPPTARGTFRTRNSARCIDYYLMWGAV